MTGDLFAGLARDPSVETITEGALLLRAFVDEEEAAALMAAIDKVLAASPLRHMQTPGGFRMSVAMSNCGQFGWVTDRRGYRYQSLDPLAERDWPAMPEAFAALAARASAAAGFAGFDPDACLINRYEPGARMSLHQDKNELDMDQPIVSVSLGLPATFLFGGMARTDKPQRMRLESGDVVVWGGPARLAFHGVDPLRDGEHPLTGRCRYNLTFRRAR
ncbi:alkylated DNA repair protein (DNA oxidative demethylase) [Herbaspirillum sp. 1173]|uniref:DNA oxidative demethylase AlkB n=1 Tax=unclassified Herbaspirillum TaxID=2624150 RepID=UPI001AE1764F|nr:DNA oxidative demethylase AlkB [Herbaspirillum sp. 1173]MBP1316067.1 alkylated DNA repair protein (DNA oxidative demethylase) [Herbaspirillum sp. 1130]MDR6740363.1 alkylated DNA repair protein (DNA oxidative demethylase) [Herbaspirillum sp. 1173]